jgi:hypothetical protein
MNEAHRHLIGLSSDLDRNNPHSKDCDDDALCATFTELPQSIIDHSSRLAHCLARLAQKSPDCSYRWGWFESRENLAVKKTIRTVYLALDQFQRYISMRPHEEKNYELATILLNAILEVTGLPCLSIDFADEKWGGYYAQTALHGNMEPLVVNTLKELIEALQRVPI